MLYAVLLRPELTTAIALAEVKRRSAGGATRHTNRRCGFHRLAASTRRIAVGAAAAVHLSMQTGRKRE